MEKKGTIISLIFVGVIVVCATCLIIFSGITAKDYNYVQLEINPRVEFVVDKNFKVVSCRPLNEDGKILLSDITFKGMPIEDASTTFIDLCAKTGYIDVDGENNAVNITVIDGITQALDVRVTENIYKYLKEKEILCTVIENYEDRNMFDEKKENKICCPNKYKLIKTLIEYDENLTVEKLNKLSEVELINMVRNIHATEKLKPIESDKQLKENLIKKHIDKYNNHISNISDKSQQEFSKTFDDFQKHTIKERSSNYTETYNNWQKQHS